MTDDNFKSYTLPRYGTRDLEFTGVLLAETTTARVGKDRWSEVRIYRTRGGKYVGEKLGRSTRPGETDLYNAYVADTPSALAELLEDEKRGGRERHLADYVYDALAAAAEIDPAFEDALVQKVD